MAGVGEPCKPPVGSMSGRLEWKWRERLAEERRTRDELGRGRWGRVRQGPHRADQRVPGRSRHARGGPGGSSRRAWRQGMSTMPKTQKMILVVERSVAGQLREESRREVEVI